MHITVAQQYFDHILDEGVIMKKTKFNSKWPI